MARRQTRLQKIGGNLNKRRIVYRLAGSVISEITDTLIQPEMGGILGVDEANNVVKFHFASTGRSTAHRYIPDVKTLNRVIGEWYESEIFFIGFVHSHPQVREQLSPCDIRYTEKIKTTCDMAERLLSNFRMNYMHHLGRVMFNRQ